MGLGMRAGIVMAVVPDPCLRAGTREFLVQFISALRTRPPERFVVDCGDRLRQGCPQSAIRNRRSPITEYPSAISGYCRTMFNIGDRRLLCPLNADRFPTRLTWQFEQGIVHLTFSIVIAFC